MLIGIIKKNIYRPQFSIVQASTESTPQERWACLMGASMVLEPTIGLILVELFQIGPFYTHYRGKREAEAKGDAGPREERSYGHGKAQPGPGRGTHTYMCGVWRFKIENKD